MKCSVLMRCHCLDSLSDMCKCGSNLNLILQSPPNTHCEYDVCYYVFDRCLWIELKKNWHCLFKQAVNACHIYICWNSANCIQDVILFIFIFLYISSVFYTFKDKSILWSDLIKKNIALLILYPCFVFLMIHWENWLGLSP